MKIRIILLSLVLMIPGGNFLLAQYEKGIQTLEYSNSNGEKGITTYIYNSHNTPYKAIWELKDGSRWSVNFHHFDTYGNLLRKDREFSDSVTVQQTYTYDENNHLVSETFVRSDGVNGNVTYIYKEGQLRYADCQGLNAWFYGQIHYRYDDNQKKIRAILKKDEAEIGTIQYSYDSSGRLKTEIWIFNTGFSQTLTYSYQDKNCINYQSSNIFINNTCSSYVREENYDYSGQGGGPSYYEYENGNKLIKKTFVRTDGLKTITTYKYQENGLLKSSHRKYMDGKIGDFKYTYNNHLQLLERHFLRSDGEKAEEKYTYGPNGKLLKAHLENFDGWLSGQLVFSQDRYDRIESADFIAKDENMAKLNFTNNSSGQVVKIHWLFSNGTSQTYNFKYSY